MPGEYDTSQIAIRFRGISTVLQTMWLVLFRSQEVQLCCKLHFWSKRSKISDLQAAVTMHINNFQSEDSWNVTPWNISHWQNQMSCLGLETYFHKYVSKKWIRVFEIQAHEEEAKMINVGGQRRQLENGDLKKLLVLLMTWTIANNFFK